MTKKRFLIVIGLMVILSALPGCSQNPAGGSQNSTGNSENRAGDPQNCAELDKLIDTTYGFKPSKLTDAERTAKSAQMDAFWNKVKADQKGLIPCLRTAISSRKADPFFRFDASNLLITLDQSDETKKTVIQSSADVDFADIDTRYWMPNIAKFGYEGLDTSAAAEAWLRYPDPGYYLPQHGAVKIDKETGALIAYGSMDEAIATPALAKIAGNADHPGREAAVRLLMQQATPESFTELQKIDVKGLSPRTATDLKVLLTKPVLLAKREGPSKITRQKFLDACQQLTAGKPDLFVELTSDSPDGERDVIAVMNEEDIPVLRKTRRFMMLSANPHSAEWYDSFTKILMAMVWKPDLGSPSQPKPDLKGKEN